MKVAPVDQKTMTGEKMKNASKADQYLLSGIHMFVYCLGLSPYKINWETGEVSFKWFSCETIWALVRLVLFNSPFSFLPIVLFGLFGIAEWENQEWGELADVKNVTTTLSATSNATLNATSEATSNAAISSASTSTVPYQILFTLEYISCYSYFILSKVAKK